MTHQKCQGTVQNAVDRPARRLGGQLNLFPGQLCPRYPPDVLDHSLGQSLVCAIHQPEGSVHIAEAEVSLPDPKPPPLASISYRFRVPGLLEEAVAIAP